MYTICICLYCSKRECFHVTHLFKIYHLKTAGYFQLAHSCAFLENYWLFGRVWFCLLWLILKITKYHHFKVHNDKIIHIQFYLLMHAHNLQSPKDVRMYSLSGKGVQTRLMWMLEQIRAHEFGIEAGGQNLAWGSGRN